MKSCSERAAPVIHEQRLQNVKRTPTQTPQMQSRIAGRARFHVRDKYFPREFTHIPPSHAPPKMRSNRGMSASDAPRAGFVFHENRASAPFPRFGRGALGRSRVQSANAADVLQLPRGSWTGRGLKGHAKLVGNCTNYRAPEWRGSRAGGFVLSASAASPRTTALPRRLDRTRPFRATDCARTRTCHHWG